ncbi:unnamed protein product [Lactuca saligna]|uniref:Uncharacterized protein n=1 Tax=Lactuca saligna TaxID=75948 RepID=A0AA35YEQ5_LACSI|nr:unnamed protein product [Lactuca saligna]
MTKPAIIVIAAPTKRQQDPIPILHPPSANNFSSAAKDDMTVEECETMIQRSLRNSWENGRRYIWASTGMLGQGKKGNVGNDLEGRPQEVREVIGTEDDSEVRRYKAKMEERARREEDLFARAPLTSANAGVLLVDGPGQKALDNINLFSASSLLQSTCSLVQVKGVNVRELCVRSVLVGVCFHSYQQGVKVKCLPSSHLELVWHLLSRKEDKAKPKTKGCLTDQDVMQSTKQAWLQDRSTVVSLRKRLKLFCDFQLLGISMTHPCAATLLYKSDTLLVVPLKGYDSHHITEEHLGGKIISRSVLLCAFEGIPYLLCALGMDIF